jgi:hypothetical protein
MVIIAYCGFALMPIPFIPEFFFELAPIELPPIKVEGSTLLSPRCTVR